MTDINATGNADAQFEESAELSAPTLDDFMVEEPKPIEAEDQNTEEVVEDQEEAEDESSNEQDESEGEAEEGEVLSQELDLDQIPEEDRPLLASQLLDSLSEDQRKDFYEEAKGRVGKDMSKFRKETAEFKKRAEAAESKALELEGKVFGSDNPFSTILDSEKLDEKAAEVDNNIRAARQFLRSGDDYITIGEKEYDRGTIDGWLDVYLAQKDAIPKQRERIRASQRAKEKLQSSEESLKSTYDWMESESGDSYDKYQKLINDPKWGLVADLIPELAGDLPKILAKYASGDEPVAKKKIKVKGKRVPKGDITGSPQSRKKKTAQSKALENLKSGSASERDKLAMFM